MSWRRPSLRNRAAFGELPAEAGVADLDGRALKERVTSLKAIRDQAQADAERAAAMLQAVTPQTVQRFARTARERIRIGGGGYRRDHLRARPAQRAQFYSEVAEGVALKVTY